MSILANITVYQCDDCRQVAVVTTDEDCDSFDANWSTSVAVDFCPACKNKAANRARIVSERKLFNKTEDRPNGH